MAKQRQFNSRNRTLVLVVEIEIELLMKARVRSLAISQLGYASYRAYRDRCPRPPVPTRGRVTRLCTRDARTTLRLVH